MKSSPMTPLSSPLMSFSLDHLLLNGFIRDTGQLSPEQIAELDARAERGELERDDWSDPSGFTIWWVSGRGVSVVYGARELSAEAML